MQQPLGIPAGSSVSVPLALPAQSLQSQSASTSAAPQQSPPLSAQQSTIETAQTAPPTAAPSQSASAATSQRLVSANFPDRLIALNPLGAHPLSPLQQYQSRMVDVGFRRLVMPVDSMRVKKCLPRNPVATPPYYPSVPPEKTDTMEFYKKLQPETLFFIFYFYEVCHSLCPSVPVSLSPCL